MTATGLDALRDELERLRRKAGFEVAQGMRAARAYGSGSNNDEYHAVREEQLVLEARISLLEDTIARAAVVDPRDSSGEPLIGSTVLIEDLDSGATNSYRLTGAHDPLTPDTISAASPMGQALVGARPGAIVTVELPNGRSRRVRLVDVTRDGSAGAPTRAAA